MLVRLRCDSNLDIATEKNANRARFAGHYTL
jgi:hypothetical protein